MSKTSRKDILLVLSSVLLYIFSKATETFISLNTANRVNSFIFSGNGGSWGTEKSISDKMEAALLRKQRKMRCAISSLKNGRKASNGSLSSVSLEVGSFIDSEGT